MSSIHRTRVFQTLRGERADRIPQGEFFIADEFVRAFLGLAPARPVEFQQRRAVVEQLDLDIASVAFSAGWGALDALVRWSTEGERFVFALVDGPFSAAARARGFNMLMHYVGGAPEAARDLFRRGADETRVVAQAARDAGADGVILGEDIAYGKGTYVAPGALRELYFPVLTALARDVRGFGLAVFFHSDGNLNAVLDDLVDAGLDGIQGLEPEAGMDLDQTWARVGQRLTLWGNLGFHFLASPVDASMVASVHAASPQTRYIFGSCAGLVQGMNVETVRRVYLL